MNRYAAERMARERATAYRAQAAQRRPAGSTGRAIRHRTGWALIQLGLALVTASARGAQRAVSPDLP